MKMNRKLLSAILVLIMLLSVAGCGAKDKGKDTLEKKVDEQSDEKKDEKPAEEKAIEGTLVEAGEFSFAYTDDWIFVEDEDLDKGETSTNAYIELKGEEADTSDGSMTIYVKKNDRADFTADMAQYDMDSKEAILNNAYDRKTIGGVEFIASEGTYSSKYMAYDEENNSYIEIYVSAEITDERVTKLLDSISFTVSPYTEKSTPWYWEGEPYSVEDHTVTVGSYTVSATQIKIEEENFKPTFDIFGSRIALAGDTVYLMRNGKVMTFNREGNVLKNGAEYELPYEPEDIFTDKNGALYISDFVKPYTVFASGTSKVISEETSYVAVHPSGAMGVSWFSSGDLKVVNNETGEVTDMTVPGFKTVSHVFVTQNYLFLSGSRDDADGSCLKILDMNGEQIAMITKEDTTTGYYGSVSAIAETANGLMIIDGNMRDIYFTDLNGSLIAMIGMEDLFGTDYPWPSSAVTTPDGKILVVLTDERADDSCDETVVFEVSGF